jgi:hypothetical protein
MAQKLEAYRFREGITPLSEKELNARFFDLDARLNALEQLSITWESSVAALNNLGIERLNSIIVPIVSEATSVLSEITTLREDLEGWLGSGTIGAAVVTFSPPSGMVSSTVQDALAELDTRTLAIIGSATTLAGRVTAIESWQSSHTHTQAQITDLSHDAIKIRGRNISASAPTNNQALAWDAANSLWIPKTVEGGVGSGMTVITATGNFTVPASTLIVELVGGGGGGGRSNSLAAPGCGGGGGGYAKKIITGLTVGNVITATIGAGGVKAAASNTAGSAGGATSFGTHLSATGGAGGAAGINTAVDAGVGSNGNLNLRGGMGESNLSVDSSYSIYGTGRGGDSKFGVGGISKPQSSIAKAPTGYGAGGYGGLSNVAASDGTPGVIIVHY